MRAFYCDARLREREYVSVPWRHTLSERERERERERPVNDRAKRKFSVES